MNNKKLTPSVNIQNLNPFGKLCMTIGMIPSSYKLSLTYEEQLLWFCDFLENTVIPTVNNNAEAVTELQNLYIQLKNYVDNYFTNLDIQNEINKKLDEMVEDGTLNSILQNYASITKIYNTYQDFISDNTLVNNQKIKTLGYYDINDGGGAEYFITSIQNTNKYQIPILNNLFAEMIIKNHTVNVKQFGAKGDGITDDSIAIQNAINSFIKDDQTTKNQNYFLVFENNFPTLNGFIKFDKATYIISKTIIVPCYIDLDFGGSEIKASNSNSNNFIDNFMFSVNSPDCNGWVYQYVPTYYSIANGTINGNNIPNLRGFYCVDSHKFNNLTFKYLYNAITYPSSYYVDNINISLCNFLYFNGDDFAILKQSFGENALLEQLHFATTKNLSVNVPFNSISWSSGWSLNLTNILNGNISLNNVRNATIANMHNENGNIVLINSSVTILDSNIYVRDINENHDIITLKDTYNNNNFDVKPVVLQNVLFRYQLNENTFDYNTNELNIVDFKNSLNLNNVYRLITTPNHQALCGITLKTANGLIYNIYDNCNLYNNFFIPQKSFSRTTLNNIVNGVDEDTNIQWSKNNGTYFYRLINFLDIDRKIGTPSSEFSFVANDKGASISMTERTGYGVLTRIYRGTTSGIYNEYVDIPNVNNRRIFDSGLACNGYQWQSLDTPSDIPSVGGCTNYEFLPDLTNNNTRVIIHKSNVANVGTWNVGDIIINNSPNLRNFYGWICIESGEPGTWKTINLP